MIVTGINGEYASRVVVKLETAWIIKPHGDLFIHEDDFAWGNFRSGGFTFWKSIMDYGQGVKGWDGWGEVIAVILRGSVNK